MTYKFMFTFLMLLTNLAEKGVVQALTAQLRPDDNVRSVLRLRCNP
jgi:hypothetical protein